MLILKKIKLWANKDYELLSVNIELWVHFLREFIADGILLGLSVQATLKHLVASIGKENTSSYFPSRVILRDFDLN